jgi:branched-chain amino acid aminotransferase
MKAWFDGRWFEDAAPAAPLLSHALHYGTGVFEGIRCYRTPRGPALFRLDDHLERFARGARRLGMKLDLGALRKACLEVVDVNGLQEAYVRPIAFYAEGGLGLDLAPLSLHVAVAALPWNSHLGARAARLGASARISTYRRNDARAIPPLKLTGAYVNSVLAKLEAARTGFDEALFVDDAGRVCEATGENVFMVRAGRVTAALHPDALPGITRDTLIELAGAEERELPLDELLEADEAFLTGTSAEVTPLAQLGDRMYGVGRFTRQLQEAYASAVRRGPDRWLSLAREEAHAK